MRVIAGTARSVPLMTPAGLDTRPTTDKIKETLFNMIHFDIPDCVFVDLFSGSGAIGIEALSRGASHAYLVDNNKKAIECIKANIAKCKFSDDATIISRDASDALYLINDKADIIFMDPPYGQGQEDRLLDALKSSSLLKKETIIIVETAIDREFDDLLKLGYDIVKEKRYKTNKHTFLKSE